MRHIAYRFLLSESVRRSTARERESLVEVSSTTLCLSCFDPVLRVTCTATYTARYRAFVDMVAVDVRSRRLRQPVHDSMAQQTKGKVGVRRARLGHEIEWAATEQVEVLFKGARGKGTTKRRALQHSRAKVDTSERGGNGHGRDSGQGRLVLLRAQDGTIFLPECQRSAMPAPRAGHSPPRSRERGQARGRRRWAHSY